MSKSVQDIREVIVTEHNLAGEGIVRLSGEEIYIRHALKGERLKVAVGEPFAAGSKRRPGMVLSVEESSPCRESRVPCALFERCGGCSLMHVRYEEQCAMKSGAVLEAALQCASHLQDPDTERMLKDAARDFVPSRSTECRSKTVRYFGNDPLTGETVAGFYAARTHSLIRADHCVLESERFSEVIREVTRALNALGIRSALQDASDLEECRARALMLRSGDDDALLADLMVTAPPPESLKEALRETARKSNVSSLYVSVNDSRKNSLFSDSRILVAGESHIACTVAGKKFMAGPDTFMQVNPEIRDRLYKAAVEHCASGKGRGTALDLCCGVGTMTLSLGDVFSRVIGVESVEGSVRSARLNAIKNGTDPDRVSFIAGDVRKVLPSLVKPLKEHRIDAVISDPARAGIGEECARLLSRLPAPCRLAMIYCSLTALKRELPVLLKGGFRVDALQGFDMFPHSGHVESLLLLSKE